MFGIASSQYLCLGCNEAWSSRPRILPCGHSICSMCLRRHFAEGLMSCPSCMTVHALDHSVCVPINHALEALMEYAPPQSHTKMQHIVVPGKSMLREYFPQDLPDSATNNISRKQEFSGQRTFRQDGEVVFGSHHQGEDIFEDFSRGSQCTCMALMMLISASEDFQFNRHFVDRVMNRGDILYTTVVIDLKAEGKFVDKMLSLDELPTSVSVDTRYQITKHVISTGFAITETDSDPHRSLQQVLKSALELSRFVLIMIGGICSSVYRHKSNRYIFFDSHSHGPDGMSSHQGKAIMVSYESLDDLVPYLYAFYSSKDLKLTSQFEALPISITAVD